MDPLKVEYKIKIMYADWSKLRNILSDSNDLQLVKTSWKAKVNTAIKNLEMRIDLEKASLKELQEKCKHEWEDVSDSRGNRDSYQCIKCHCYK